MEREWCNACQAETPQQAVGLAENHRDYVLLVCETCGRMAHRGKRSLLQPWQRPAAARD